MKTKSGSPQLCRFYAPRFRFPPSSPARGRPGIGLHSICPVDRCDRRCGQKLDQGLRGQWLLGGGWGTAMYTKSGLCRSGGRAPITSMPATSMSSLIGCMPISASPRWTTSQYLSPEPIPAGRPRRHITPPTAPTFFGAVAEDRDWRILQSWRLTPRPALGPDDDEGRATGDADFRGLAACALNSSRFRVTASASSCSAERDIIVLAASAGGVGML